LLEIILLNIKPLMGVYDFIILDYMIFIKGDYVIFITFA
jgi:hypothetical protein